MKKYILVLISILLFSGCSNTPDSTLLSFLNRSKNSTDIKYSEAEYVNCEDNTATSSGYYLAKRGDRYAAADINITPQDYSVVASRTVNKMLSEVPAVFATDKQAPLYIADMVQIDRYLPEGSYAAEKATKDILYGSKMFNITEDKEQAVYILQSSISNINTPEIPIIIYRMELYDAAGKKLKSWQDTIRQVQNDDRSWW